jgi:hypothetical protein
MNVSHVGVIMGCIEQDVRVGVEGCVVCVAVLKGEKGRHIV